MKKHMLMVALVVSLCADLSAGAATWRQTAQAKLSRARKTVSSYYQTLREKSACLRAGTCPEVRAALKVQAIAAGKALAVIGAVAGTGAALYYGAQKEDAELSPAELEAYRAKVQFSAPRERPTIEIGPLLTEVVIPPGDSIPGLFIKAVSNGAEDTVNRLVELVDEKVLLAAREIASNQAATSQVTRIRGIIDAGIGAFNLRLVQKRNQFIRSAVGGLDAEIWATICSVSPQVVEEATLRVQEELRRSDVIKGPLEAVEGVLLGGCSGN